MVLVSIEPCGANLVLSRYEVEAKPLKTHESTRPTANQDDVETFRRSPLTVQRFGFWNAVEARVRGLNT